ncbi:MAG TPA: hypothetical protein VGB49_07860 [Caulobacteraceae bacterium]
MRTALAMLAGLAVVGLGACATTTPTDSEYRELVAECQARGGVLTANGRVTGNTRADYNCEIHGGPSDRVRR